MPAHKIRPVAAADRPQWELLYRGYAGFYRVDTGAEKLDRLWGWLMARDHVVEGLVAEAGGRLAGLAHFRAMPSPLRGEEIGFLDDLFVDPAARGGRLGEALIAEIRRIAAGRGWGRIRWITRDNNYRARALYDRVAVKTDWNMYEFEVQSAFRQP